MKLDFEKWLDNQSEVYDDKQIKEVFSDAVLCFKNGIYRPALHLSFVGFMFLCRNRILNMKRLEIYTEGEWNTLLNEIKAEDTWEKKVINKLNETASNE